MAKDHPKALHFRGTRRDDIPTYEVEGEFYLAQRPTRLVVDAVAWDGNANHSSIPELPGIPSEENREELDIAVSVYDTRYSPSFLEPEIGGPVLGLTEDDFDVTVVRGLPGGILTARLRSVDAVGDFYRLRVRPRGGNSRWGAGHVLLGITVHSRMRAIRGQTVCGAHLFRIPAQAAPSPPPQP
ncbi:MAG: hypothetical protein AAF962_22490 [Actinomycetota bacterium]